MIIARKYSPSITSDHIREKALRESFLNTPIEKAIRLIFDESSIDRREHRPFTESHRSASQMFAYLRKQFGVTTVGQALEVIGNRLVQAELILKWAESGALSNGYHKEHVLKGYPEIASTLATYTTDILAKIEMQRTEPRRPFSKENSAEKLEQRIKNYIARGMDRKLLKGFMRDFIDQQKHNPTLTDPAEHYAKVLRKFALHDAADSIMKLY
jgi:hypothetical protein